MGTFLKFSEMTNKPSAIISNKKPLRCVNTEAKGCDHMPVAKYKRDPKSKLYYTYEKTGQHYPNGKPKYQKLRAKTIARLDEKVTAFKENQALHVEPSKTTVDEWYEHWFAAYKSHCRDTTRLWYENLYSKHIKPSIGSMRVVDVREIHAQAILSNLSDSHAEKTVKSIRKILFELFDKARLNRMIPANPAEKLTATGRKTQQRRALTKSERKAYLQACKTHSFGEFAAMIYFFGLRRGEAAALLGSDIHVDFISVTKQHAFPGNSKPVIGPPKTAAGVRNIVIPDSARDYIDFNKLRKKGNKLLFSSENEMPLTYSRLYAKWSSFLDSAFPDGTEITEHYLRHNYCVLLFEAQVDLLTIQRLMGHDRLQTTVDIYAHYSESLKKTGEEKAAQIGK